MSKSKSKSMSTVASTLSGIAEQISSASLSKTDRRNLQSRNEIVPDALVEMIAHLSEQGNGTVLGMPFDATTARSVLAQTSTAQTAISVGRQTLQRMEDDMIQTRATVADPSFAIYTALRRLVKTKAGNALAPAYAQMKAIVKNRPRKTRKKKTTDEAANATPTTPSAPAVEAPATPLPPSSAPAPAPKAVASTSN